MMASSTFIMTPRLHRLDHTPFSRLVHLLLLAGWLLSSQGVIPALCLAAALVDGDHAVKVRVLPSGDFSVVLSHEGQEGTAIFHQHDPLCSLVVAFAQKPVAGEPDHVLSFKSLEDASRTLRRPSIQVYLPVLAVTISLERHCQSVARAPVSIITHVQAPAWSPGLEIKTSRTILRC